MEGTSISCACLLPGLETSVPDLGLGQPRPIRRRPEDGSVIVAEQGPNPEEFDDTRYPIKRSPLCSACGGIMNWLPIRRVWNCSLDDLSLDGTYDALQLNDAAVQHHLHIDQLPDQHLYHTKNFGMWATDDDTDRKRARYEQGESSFDTPVQAGGGSSTDPALSSEPLPISTPVIPDVPKPPPAIRPTPRAEMMHSEGPTEPLASTPTYPTINSADRPEPVYEDVYGDGPGVYGSSTLDNQYWMDHEEIWNN